MEWVGRNASEVEVGGQNAPLSVYADFTVRIGFDAIVQMPWGGDGDDEM